MKSESWLIIQVGAALLLILLLGFFFAPRYEKGVELVMNGFLAAFSGLLGYKFGRSMPQQTGTQQAGQVGDTKPGTASTETTEPPK